MNSEDEDEDEEELRVRRSRNVERGAYLGLPLQRPGCSTVPLRFMPDSFDLIVLGGGPAGTSAAAAAGFLGKRAALVELAGMLGGAGINTGTLPSKTLRETALVLSGWRSRRLFGVDLSLQREATIGDFMRHSKNVSARSEEHTSELQ